VVEIDGVKSAGKFLDLFGSEARFIDKVLL
jgi:hypothetical protein